ncbi:MAG: hypothetical protein EHM21_13665, partial [Chloroflexi bacterium]
MGRFFMDKDVSASRQAGAENKKSDQVPQIERVQAELSDLLIKVQRLPERDQNEIAPTLEKIYTELYDLVNEKAPPSNPLSAGQATGVLPPEWAQKDILDSDHAQLVIVSYEWDIPSDRLAFSPGLKRITGHDAEPRHNRWLKKIFPEDHSRIQPTLAKIRLDYEAKRPIPNRTLSYEFEYRFQHADGGWVNLWDRAVIEHDAQGRPILAVGVLED